MVSGRLGAGAGRKPGPAAPEGGLESVEKRMIDRKVLDLQFSLLCADEAPVGPERLEEVVPWFTPAHWDAVVEERSTMSYCGYPACARSPEGRGLAEGQIKIDARLKKITQITRENTMYCSDLCETASRVFKSRLSSEATFFRPIARAYIEEATGGRGGAAHAKYDQSPLGKQSGIGDPRQDACLPPDTYVFDLVQKSFGSLSLDGEAHADAALTPDGHSGTCGGVKEEKAAASVVKPHKRPVVRRGSVVRRKKEERDKGGGSNAARAKAQEERLHNGADTRTLKFEVVERTAFETPQPIDVQYIRASDVEGHPVSLPKPVLPPRKDWKHPSAPHEDDSEEVIEGVLSDDEDAGSDDVDVGGGDGESKAVGRGDVEQWVWEPTEPDAQDADADDEGPGTSVVDDDFFMQLWTTLSEWITPESHVFVRRLAEGEDVAAVAADLHASCDVSKRRSDVMVLRREGALGDMLAGHSKPAVEALGLVHMSHAEVSKRMLGLVSTFDLARTPTPAFFTNRHYKALALVLLGVTFDVDKGEGPRGPAASAPQSSVQGGGGPRPADALLTKLGLQSYEYASLMRDFIR